MEERGEPSNAATVLNELGLVQGPVHSNIVGTQRTVGDSTTNVMKTITLETGKKIQAPLFIKNGERLKVDTREGKYMERVNK